MEPTTLLQVLIAFLVAAGVRANCPRDFSRSIQLCTQDLTMAATSNPIQNLSQVESFCHQGVEKAMKCVNKNIDQCAQTQSQREVLDMLINVDRVTGSLENFCDNINVLVEKRSCLSHVNGSDSCMLNVMRTFQYQVSQAYSAKRMMDLTCGHFDDVTRCFTKPFPPECGEVAGLYRGLLQANKFPYCDLSQEDKLLAAAKLEEARGTAFASHDNGASPLSPSSSSFLLLQLLLLATFLPSLHV